VVSAGGGGGAPPPRGPPRGKNLPGMSCCACTPLDPRGDAPKSRGALPPADWLDFQPATNDSRRHRRQQASARWPGFAGPGAEIELPLVSAGTCRSRPSPPARGPLAPATHHFGGRC